MGKRSTSLGFLSLGILATAMLASDCLAVNTADLDPTSSETRYQFLLFWKQADAATSQARQTLDAFAAKRVGQLIVSDIRVGDPAAQKLVKHYGVSRAPMPLVLTVAPNGAVTEAIMHPLDDKKLAAAIVSPASADCLKGMQDGKIVFVCVHRQGTSPKDGAFEGVQQFAADKNYRKVTQLVHVDPVDPKEGTLLKQLKIDPQTCSPTTVMVAPSGATLGKFVGSTTKAEFVKTLTALKSACCPGGTCGPNGCCPK
ncbi:hypothetical protein [Adhaeretor mobilis]|uniref:Thioredoxin domain-containing protein n=1 Tax=Adhaeretor mobilis TaxID=1930276 RepID=A0A517MTL2_9BACT|nr:hypothetical protein [Adhaeretor mobilis]QDS98220.1 hypothetical protein HG15A2_14930 [Adhaeretor mobilis]